MISFKHKGNFNKVTQYFKRVKKSIDNVDFDKYGRAGVAALESATPVDSGLTAKSWYYKVNKKDGLVTISFHNSNIQNGVLVAILLQYGHGTRNGGWVEGGDYINPASRPIFDAITKNAWREVTRE